MCGICAIVGGRIPPPAAAIKSMVAALRHRGPDAQSYRRLDGCDLGHARLSIIDLDNGAQPLADAAGRYWIVFNGEIYNYQELRDTLARAGHRFHTRSDTEVILAAYREWGSACLDRFRGMFAFAIWDTHERQLFAARDLFGEKPLYYAATPSGALLLASEIKSITASGLVQPRIAPSGIDDYLCLGYMPPDRTVYENVQTLAPGHYLEWNGNGAPSCTCYWRPKFNTTAIGADEAGERLRTLLEQAVRRQMVADVPVGAFLSGGHDSSTIVALMARQASQPVRTFSVGFGEWINELPYARAVARQYRTDHHDIDLGTLPVADLLERMAEVYDEPFMDPSHVPTYLISEYARRHVKVVLSGDGADELFGGYAWYPLLAASMAVSGSELAWIAARGVSRLLRDRVPALRRHSQARGLARRWPDPVTRYVHYRSALSAGERAALWGGPETPPAFLSSTYYRSSDRTQGMDKVLDFDLRAFLPGDILVKVDRAAMAHGLETRAPFLDRDLVEFALTLPSGLKVTADQTKVLFKQALARYWPEALHQRGKQGFAAPYQAWLAREDVQALVRRVFRPGAPLRQLLPGLPVISRPAHDYHTWSLLTLGLWLERQPFALSDREGHEALRRAPAVS
jgi:asparagine synthase (glutamine-hydrolysing)